MPYTTTDLGLPATEITQIEARLETLSGTDIATVMAEQEGKVDQYTASYTIDAARRKRLWRPLAIYELYVLLKMVSEAVRRAYEDAMKELEAIRDGKFASTLAPASNPPTTNATGSWGSNTKIKSRSDG